MFPTVSRWLTKLGYLIQQREMSKIYQTILLFVSLLGMTACHFNQQKPLFKQLSSTESGIDFVNQLNYTDSLTVLEFEYMFNGAGVALADINNDGLLDIFFAGNMVSSRLYLNKGNLHFEDITQQAGVKTEGWAFGVSVVDINQDGFKDFYVCKAGSRNTPVAAMKNLFFINNGDNTFKEVAAELKLDDDGYDIQTTFFDYDKDGDLDMYLLRNSFVNYNRNNSRPKQTDGQSPTTGKLFRNDSPLPKTGQALNLNELKFTDVSYEEGIRIEGFGLGISVCDLNNDNYPDLYISNDFLTNDLVYINQHDDKGNHTGFKNEAGNLLHHQTYNGMGNDVADINNDGYQDIAVVDMLPPDNSRWKLTMMGNTYEEFQQNIKLGYEPQYVRNTLQLNNGLAQNGEKGISFSEIGQLAGVHATEWSWAPLFADYDNDGWKDLMIANGYREDVTNLDFIMYGKQTLFMGTPEANRHDRLEELKKFPGIHLHNYLFKNQRNLTFKDVSEDWGFDTPSYSNGAAYGDLDNDGDLDLVFNNLDEVSTIQENQLNRINPENAWLRIGFKGNDGNKEGLGAKVWIWQQGQMQYNYFSPFRGYLSTVEPFLHFGLTSKAIDSLKVMWPDGKTQVIRNPKANQVLTLAQSNALQQIIKTKEEPKNSFFVEASQETGIQFKHEEDLFVDFHTQALLPHTHSKSGPAIAVADVNGDGLEDFFVGAGAGSKGGLFIQKNNGSFSQETIDSPNVSDDMGILFFDADQDGDQDLYLASGGVLDKETAISAYQHRFFINDGKGHFTKSNAIPSIQTSASAVVATDFDRDGDLDVFVGGRVSPNEYPKAPRSYLLRNDSRLGLPKFTDITLSVAPSLARIGMVSSALWTDYNNDGWQDLMLVGEYMPITFVLTQHGKLSEQVSIEHSKGWWNSIAAGDFDKDGDTDYVMGNLGLNSQQKASVDEPTSVYAKDYDKNGVLDPILCHYLDGQEQIFHTRDDLNKQMTAMRARFNDYTTYASTPFRKSFLEEELADALHLEAQRFETSYLQNEGNGKFQFKELPLAIQFAPVFGMLTEDVDLDGNLDLLTVGNSFATEVGLGRYDAQGSLFLKGDGKGKFTAQRSFFVLSGDNKSITKVHNRNNQTTLLVGTNSSPLKVYKQLQPTEEVIKLLPTETAAIITLNNGQRWKQECYYGQGYLSQQGRTLTVPKQMKSIELTDSKGKRRLITQANIHENL